MEDIKVSTKNDLEFLQDELGLNYEQTIFMAEQIQNGIRDFKIVNKLNGNKELQTMWKKKEQKLSVKNDADNSKVKSKDGSIRLTVTKTTSNTTRVSISLAEILSMAAVGIYAYLCTTNIKCTNKYAKRIDNLVDESKQILDGENEK